MSDSDQKTVFSTPFTRLSWDVGRYHTIDNILCIVLCNFLVPLGNALTLGWLFSAFEFNKTFIAIQYPCIQYLPNIVYIYFNFHVQIKIGIQNYCWRCKDYILGYELPSYQLNLFCILYQQYLDYWRHLKSLTKSMPGD